MKRHYQYIKAGNIIRQLLLLLSFFLLPGALSAKDFYGYTHDRPLVIVSDWDFRPYEFVDDEGRPAGYNIEVLELILNKLEIPHRFVMREWQVATQIFERQEADLIHALPNDYKTRPYVMTQKYMNFYTLCVARRSDTAPMKHLGSLDSSSVIMMKQNDYAFLYIHDIENRPFKINFCSPKDGLAGISSGKYQYYIWGELPLKRKAKELALDNIEFDEVDIPAGELHIIGYDKEVIDVIDEEYTRLEQAGELQNIYDRWFRPERIHDDASPYSVIVVVGLVVVILVTILLGFLMTRRVNAAVSRQSNLNSMMIHALTMGDYYVLEWDLHANWLQNNYGTMLPDGGMSPQEFLSRTGPGQAEILYQKNAQLVKGEISQYEIRISLNKGTPEAPNWREYYGNAIREDENGKPRYVVYTAKDITREVEEENYNQKMASKYMHVFDTNLIAMSFYGSNGCLYDMNQKMRELCQLHGEEDERYFRENNLFDFPVLKGDFDPQSRDPFYVCQHMHYPEIGIDKYIEFRIMPTFNDGGQLVYYVITSRDLTDERNMYMELRSHDRQLQRTNEDINRYEKQLHYLLEESNMFVWKFDLQKKRIDFSHTLRQAYFSETIDEFFSTMSEDHREKARAVMQESVMHGKPFTSLHHFDYTLVSPEPAWYSISGMPVYEKDGSIKEYFGIVRNVTDLMEAQEKLRKETMRAEDSGRLKSAFLANMTHEIRTPLNAIVGFSDLLPMIDTEEERMEFIRIIRNNCDMLLRLINDILEASSLGQSLHIEVSEVDLPKVFDDICQTLQQRVQEPGVEFLKDNPYDTYTAVLDKGRLQQLLTNFVTNAVKYTQQGHIKVGWRPMNSEELPSPSQHVSSAQGLYFYCEDTGAGIPKEKQASVFERFVKLNDFVQGTGLGLSICQNIVEKCGGTIGVTSEGEGHGSTFWFWIPKTEN